MHVKWQLPAMLLFISACSSNTNPPPTAEEKPKLPAPAACAGDSAVSPPAMNEAVALKAPDAEPDYAGHLRDLKSKIPDESFYVVLEKPFVVLGNEPEHEVRRHAEETVKWAVTLLKKDYFEKDPPAIIDIWLFKNAEDYEKYSKGIFHNEATSPFGYYLPSERALIMNIATGGGTLVHEIVHPYVAANFPNCPAWFNEGLASLYEASFERNGHIAGGLNWRLPILQKAIREKRLGTFKGMTALSDNDFYNKDRGENYSQARYLCYYLQQEGKLRDFYRDFRANAAQDPTGYTTLVAVLGNPDMAEFQSKWEKWILGLSR